MTRKDNIVTLTAGSVRVSMNAVGSDGEVIPLTADGSIKVDAAEKVRVSIAGFGPSSDVELWMMSTPVALGSTTVNETGTADAVFTMPVNIEPGDHRLVISGVDALNQEVVMSLGVRVNPEATVASWSRVFLLILLLAAGGALFLPAVLRRRKLS